MPTQICHTKKSKVMRQELELTKLHMQRINIALKEFKEF